VLCEYADKYGIALVDTQGFLTDYGRDLIAAAEVSGANIAIVSDYDASGIKLAHDAGDIQRLGVDQEMLDYFGLDRESKTLSVLAKAKKDVITPIQDLVDGDTLEYLKRRKVEIDAVIAVVGNKRFWEYLIKKLEEYHPTRDYTRVIEPAPDLSGYYPESAKDIEHTIKRYADVIVADERKKITDELEEYEGLIDDIGVKRFEILKTQGAILEKDEYLKELNEKLKEVKPLLEKIQNLTKEIEKQQEGAKKEQQQKKEQRKEQRRQQQQQQQQHKDELQGTQEIINAQRKFELRQKFGSILSKHNLEIQDVEGVGPTTARKFKEAGIITVIDLAAADVDELALDINSSKETVEMFIKAANKLLEDTKQQAEDVV